MGENWLGGKQCSEVACMAARNLSGAVIYMTLLVLVKVNSSQDPPVIVCNTAELECKNGRCVPESWVCDGEDDCGDKTDEKDCDPDKLSTCQPEEFRCDLGECIPIAWQCDGEKDCPGDDNLDEWDQLCQKERCIIGEFRCEIEGLCIQESDLCDGHTDCIDGSDETCCNVTCSTEEFQCLDRKCIQARWHCDGDSDCDDGADEKGCKHLINSTGECKTDSFACHNKEECINSGWVCDGDADCADASDESEETCGVKSKCKEDQFECKSGECIPSHLRCSENIECLDGSDEKDCVIENLPIYDEICDPDLYFHCGESNICIPLERVCDRANDCGNWEDEDSCHHNECMDNNGGCDHICIDTASSFFCDCRPGFSLSGNSTCNDINECDTVLGACSQICENTVGSFECSCINGFKSGLKNPNRCVIAFGKVGVIFAHQTDLRLLDISTKETSVIVEGELSATHLDYHYREKQVYWTDSENKGVFQAKIGQKSSGRKAFADGQISSGDGIAVDWVYDNIYLTNAIRQTISVLCINGGHIADVVEEDLEKPRSIAVLPSKGWIFWSDWGNFPKIEKAGMDGTNRSVLATENLMWPNGITLDLVSERLYWVDAKLHIIGSVRFDGTVPIVITEESSALHHPFSVSVLEDWVYWTEWVQNGSSIFRANKFNGTDLEKITDARMHHKPMSLQVYHPMKQPPSNNFCLARINKCSHICVPQPQSLQQVSEPFEEQDRTACLCPRDFIKKDDDANCVSKLNDVEVELLLKRRKESLDVISKSEIVEVVKDDGNNHLLAPILGIVAVIVFLFIAIVS